MATVQITISKTGLRTNSVEKLMRRLKDEVPGASVSVATVFVPESRPDRFNMALGKIGDAKSEMESLRDELQEWKDGMPENLQTGSKAEELDEAISNLETLAQALEEAEGIEVSFPSMM